MLYLYINKKIKLGAFDFFWFAIGFFVDGINMVINIRFMVLRI